MPALPFSKISRSVSRPKSESYPKELKTIGDHIRAWRIDKCLLQKDIAQILSVCEDTIVGWEMRGTIPGMKQMPQIIKMLGYLPVKIDVSILGGKIAHYRYMHGLTPEEFGLIVRANASAVREQIVIDKEDITIKLSYLPHTPSFRNGGNKQRDFRGSWKQST